MATPSNATAASASSRVAELRKRNKLFLSGGSEPVPGPPPPHATRPTRPTDRKWAEGEMVRMENRVWRVGLVNESRMRLDPVTPNKIKILDNVINDYGGSVNVSPNSVLPRVTQDDLDDDERRREAKLIERGTRTPEHVMEKGKIMAPAAQAPGGETGGGPVTPTVSANRNANKERLERLRKANAGKTTNGKAAAAPPVAAGKSAKATTKAKPAKELKPCHCGCGEMVPGYFVQGHDARFKGWLLKIERGQMAVKDLPKSVQSAYEWRKKGDGMIPTTNYKGEKHTGYEKA